MTHTFHLENCDGCGFCADNCPLGVLEVKGGKVAVADKDMCADCSICIEVCPNGVIEKGPSTGEAK